MHIKLQIYILYAILDVIKIIKKQENIVDIDTYKKWINGSMNVEYIVTIENSCVITLFT